jgi:hypothetical protein
LFLLQILFYFFPKNKLCTINWQKLKSSILKNN